MTASPVRLAPSGKPLTDFEVTGWNIVRTVADLPAAAGGFHELSSGGWLFAAPIDTGANGIRIPASAAVYVQGFGDGSALTTAAPVLFDLVAGSRAIFSGVRVTAPGSVTAFRVNNDPVSAVHFLECDVTVETGWAIESGRSFLTACRWNGVTTGVRVTGGSTDCIMNGIELVSGATGLELAGGRFVRLANANLQFFQTGVSVLAGATGVLQLEGIRGWAGADVLLAVASSLQICQVHGFSADSVANAITWAALDIPSPGGLSISQLYANNLGTIFNGFTSASARVSIRQGVGGGGFLTETVLTP